MKSGSYISTHSPHRMQYSFSRRRQTSAFSMLTRGLSDFRTGQKLPGSQRSQGKLMNAFSGEVIYQQNRCITVKAVG